MLLNQDLHPERQIYYLGALILDAINSAKYEKIDLFDIYQHINKKNAPKAPFQSYMLALDWLYILGIIENSSGNIKKCF